MPSAIERGGFEGFVNGEWELPTATPPALLPVVRDLRELFSPRADYLYRTFLKDAVATGKTRLPGVWVSLVNRLQDWQSLLLELLNEYFDKFLEIASAHAELVPDAAWWAHAQAHSLVGDHLRAFDRPKVGSGIRLLEVQKWIKEYCDGP